jgi:carbamoyltransferase
MEEAESSYVVRDGRIEIVEKTWGLWESTNPYFRFPSLGHMFSMASQYIFGHWIHAGKTMGLAPYGDPRAFPEQIIEFTEQGLRIDTEWIIRLPPRSSLAAHLDETCRNLAAKVQAELESAMLFLTRRLHERTGCKDLCISGGVALNSVANGRVLRESPFEQLFITPAAGDSGIAIGAAMYGYHLTLGATCPWKSKGDFMGRPYTQCEIESALSGNQFVQFELVDDPGRLAAEDIAAGRIVAWFEGASEFGPRALGHRSILADARDAGIKTRLNETVKFRESFRPYAASILTEHLAEYFELDVSSPFMLMVAVARTEKRQQILGICHVDDTCRLQTVSPTYDGRYRSLLEHFLRITGVPLILNTSLNIRGEPMVETPADALQCFSGSAIDVLYLNNYRVTKTSIADVQDFERLVPALNEGVSLTSKSRVRDSAFLPPSLYAQTRAGHNLQLDPIQAALLYLVDGKKSIAEISEALSESTSDVDLRSLLSGLNLHGLVSFVNNPKKDQT